VNALTFFFKGVVSQFFPEPLGADDLTFRELLVKTWNEILVRLKESGNKLTGQDYEVIGFALRRVYFVAQAYKAEHEKYTVSEWIGKLKAIAEDSGVKLS
jgi:hypothetical protein